MADRAPVGRFSHVVVDCLDPEVVAAFWAAALGVAVSGRWHQYVMLEATVHGGPSLSFQQVPEAKAGKNRVHLDLFVDDLEVASARLVALGATPGDRITEDGIAIWVHLDPEGNELCLVHVPTS